MLFVYVTINGTNMDNICSNRVHKLRLIYFKDLLFFGS